MEAFDVVVVGSGFGGAVTSFRLAAAGFDVLVLDRGASYPPNSFPRTPHDFARSFWDSDRHRYGLFDVRSFPHVDTVVSAGLGGGSLIDANVLIRKDEHWFDAGGAGSPGPWPVTRADLEPHYETVEKALGAQVFPMDVAPYSSVRKTTALAGAARALGYEATTWDRVDPKRKQWFLPQLAVTFANDGHAPVPGERIDEEIRNLHDRDRVTCRLCGELQHRVQLRVQELTRLQLPDPGHRAPAPRSGPWPRSGGSDLARATPGMWSATSSTPKGPITASCPVTSSWPPARWVRCPSCCGTGTSSST